ncbi:MAG: mannose-1-phosphate guanylyltransferase [Spirochaetota bacterium]|nr:mannose-1-phosphate guanylyltransferase [Spirochaetota bacterium]
MKALLLAGGKGTRLWPISKSQTPKQVVSPFGDQQNLLQLTINRTLEIGFNAKDLFLVTAQNQENILKQYWDETQLNEIISEPEAKNTAPAILLATKKLLELNTDPNEVIYVFPSDHYMIDFELDLSIDCRDKIFCFRIIPTRAETGYGYIKTETNDTISKVKQFTEKPNLETVEAWYNDWLQFPKNNQQDKYFWNSGIYAFSLNSLGLALEQIDPNLYQLWKSATYQKFKEQYSKLLTTPFDKFVAEQAHNLYSAPLLAKTWRDVGTWQSVYEALASTDSQENIHVGLGQSICTSDTNSCLINSDKNITIACAGVQNLAVIISGDNILILDKKNPQAMQEIITQLQRNHKDLI